MKKVYFSCHLFFNYFAFPVKSVHRENKFREVLSKDPVTKISSAEFAVFGPVKPEYSFREDFCPKGNRICSLNKLLYNYIRGFLSVIQNN